jgi:hypothetical protein
MRQGCTVFGLPTNEKFRPVKVRFFGREAIVQSGNALVRLIEQPRSVKCGQVEFHNIFYNCTKILRRGSKVIFQAFLRRKLCSEHPVAPRLSRRFCGVNYVRHHKRPSRTVPWSQSYETVSSACSGPDDWYAWLGSALACAPVPSPRLLRLPGLRRKARYRLCPRHLRGRKYIY